MLNLIIIILLTITFYLITDIYNDTYPTILYTYFFLFMNLEIIHTDNIFQKILFIVIITYFILIILKDKKISSIYLIDNSSMVLNTFKYTFLIIGIFIGVICLFNIIYMPLPIETNISLFTSLDQYGNYRFGETFPNGNIKAVISGNLHDNNLVTDFRIKIDNYFSNNNLSHRM